MVAPAKTSGHNVALARLKDAVVRVASRSPRVRSIIFERVFRGNHWGDTESASGGGSNLRQTELLRAELPGILAARNVDSMLDIPCGDGHWIRTVDLGVDSYVGGDVVPQLIQRLSADARPHEQFRLLDAARGELPCVDLILCRDLLVHLDFRTIEECLRNFKRSGSRWLLTTTFVSRAANDDITTGGWRPLNLERAPFSLPEPQLVFVEHCTEDGGIYADKALGLWDLQALQLS